MAVRALLAVTAGLLALAARAAPVAAASPASAAGSTLDAAGGAVRYSAWVWNSDDFVLDPSSWNKTVQRFNDISVAGPGRSLFLSAGHIVAHPENFSVFFDFCAFAAGASSLDTELLFVQDAFSVLASKMEADAAASVALIAACRARQSACPGALHYDLEGGTAFSITNMTLGAGLVSQVRAAAPIGGRHGASLRGARSGGQVLRGANMSGSVGLHFDTFDEWSRVGPNSTAYPCPWTGDGMRADMLAPVSINECLLRANATRLHVEDYRVQVCSTATRYAAVQASGARSTVVLGARRFPTSTPPRMYFKQCAARTSAPPPRGA